MAFPSRHMVFLYFFLDIPEFPKSQTKILDQTLSSQICGKITETLLPTRIMLFDKTTLVHDTHQCSTQGVDIHAAATSQQPSERAHSGILTQVLEKRPSPHTAQQEKYLLSSFPPGPNTCVPWSTAQADTTPRGRKSEVCIHTTRQA